MLTVLDLFSGIGGFSLGLERTGHYKTVAFCEIDKKAQQVLRKHWPEVPVFTDVKELHAAHLKATGIEVDVICGGFPCQDISTAGRGAGLAGERSGLWFEFHRLIKELRPKAAIIENVSALRSRGLDEVLRSLTEIRYDAEWHCISASALGAPHQRDRIWIVAYPSCELPHWGWPVTQQAGWYQSTNSSFQMADTGSTGLPWGQRLRHHLEEALRGWASTSRPASERCPISGGTLYSWHTEPDLGRVADGVPGRVDRLKQLGNAVVPQIPELLGEAIYSTLAQVQ